MSDRQNYASGNWTVKEGREADFQAGWREFIEWSRDNVEGFQGAHLLHDTRNSRHFVSYALWESPDAQQQWRARPRFQEMVGNLQALCDESYNSLYEETVSIQ